MPSSRQVQRLKPVSGNAQISGKDDSKARLIQTQDSTGCARSEPPTASKTNDLIRFFKLQSFAQINSWRSPVEPEKIALHSSHRIAAGHALLHLVPLCGAVTLLILNLSAYFVGPFFAYSTTLQFVAKLHELLMQMSIVEIILCVIRAQVLEGYVPLGALSATTQALSISYIWSLDFLAAITSKSFHGWRKYLFVILIPTLITLTTLVGPSSAGLMIPRPGSSSRPVILSWRYENTMDDWFPSQLGSTHNLTL